MQHTTSVFLDFLRFSAASVVFLHHITAREMNAVFPWVRWGHEAVVIFFVLSGFVIAYVLSSRERSIPQYAAARLGRLYSVVVPALALTALLDYLGRGMNPDFYASIPDDRPLLRLLVNLFFIQQNWNLTTTPLSNGPFWSLGFEFWYYMIFGAATLTKGRMRIALPLLFCLLAGPRIVAFFPLWFLGAGTYWVYQRWQPSRNVRRTLIGLNSITILTILAIGNPLQPLREAFRAGLPENYFFAGPFRIFLGDIPHLPEDLLLSALFCLLIVCVRDNPIRTAIWPKLVAAIRYLAGATFSLYLFHVPLLYFFYAWLEINRSSYLEIILVTFLVFICCLLLSYVGERQAPQYRRFFLTLFKGKS